jgi:penicillin-binding protein 1A
VGITTVIDAAHRCGIMSTLQPNASLALGTSDVTPLELTTAYATFASGGYRIYPYFVTEVDDSSGHALYVRKTVAPQRVIASHIDRDLTAMLYGVVTEGTGRSAAVSGHETAGKTGTTQDYHDAWFVGFTSDYVAGVWVGNDDATPMKTVTGGSLPAAIWHDVMTAAEKDMPATPLNKSVLEAPTDNGSLFNADGTSNGPNMDDEAGPMKGAPDQDHPNSFWNWMLGSDDQQQQAPDQQAPDNEGTPPSGDSPQQNQDDNGR